MKVWIVWLGCFLMVGCVDVSVKRVKGETKEGYTTYRTTVQVDVVDEPACEGSCRRSR